MTLVSVTVLQRYLIGFSRGTVSLDQSGYTPGEPNITLVCYGVFIEYITYGRRNKEPKWKVLV